MATRVKDTKTVPKKGTRTGVGPGFPGPNGKGPRGNGWHGGGEEPAGRLSSSAYRVTLWVILAAIVMMFGALSGTYIFLSAGAKWKPVAMPRMFYWSSAIILTSSGCLEISKRSLKRGKQRRSLAWLGTTLVLGVVFLACQLLGWRELAAQGVFFAGQPHSSFFYFFTGVHGVHLLGGIAALIYMLVRLRKPYSVLSEKTGLAMQLVSIYWHMMDVLWIWLFLLLLLLK